MPLKAPLSLRLGETSLHIKQNIFKIQMSIWGGKCLLTSDVTGPDELFAWILLQMRQISIIELQQGISAGQIGFVCVAQFT